MLGIGIPQALPHRHRSGIDVDRRQLKRQPSKKVFEVGLLLRALARYGRPVPELVREEVFNPVLPGARDDSCDALFPDDTGRSRTACNATVTTA
jgi:hypothetical protein